MAEQVELSVYVFINQSINMLQTGFQAKLQLAASQLQSNSVWLSGVGPKYEARVSSRILLVL